MLRQRDMRPASDAEIIARRSAELHIFPNSHWPSSVEFAGLQDTTIQVGFSLQAAKTSHRSVLSCDDFHFLLHCACDHNPSPTLQTDRQTDGRTTDGRYAYGMSRCMKLWTIWWMWILYNGWTGYSIASRCTRHTITTTGANVDLSHLTLSNVHTIYNVWFAKFPFPFRRLPLHNR